MTGFTVIGVQLFLAKVWSVGGLSSGGDRTTQGKVRAPRWRSPTSLPVFCGRWLSWASVPVGSRYSAITTRIGRGTGHVREASCEGAAPGRKQKSSVS